ncbi:hypothetical protein CEXT_314851 [Caerostris extrusa]|uniref:Uncharacterized protein n=1 Tax=Caerostris extrusa TaxID=172846 RepID=A0AAV4U3F1_CAEEX|nr:hypothetical protein CEXT_314851 [Caerostris extrusa]
MTLETMIFWRGRNGIKDHLAEYQNSLLDIDGLIMTVPDGDVAYQSWLPSLERSIKPASPHVSREHCPPLSDACWVVPPERVPSPTRTFRTFFWRKYITIPL